MNTTYLLLGSNLGNRQQYLADAARQIDQKIGTVTQQSAIYETQAWGNTTVPDYLNQVLKVETLLLPRQVLHRALAIELELGRRREEKWGSRTIDIDVLFYNNEVLNSVELTVPHPYLHVRRFVLEPLAELSAELVHPVLNKTISALKEELNDDLIVKKY